MIKISTTLLTGILLILGMFACPLNSFAQFDIEFDGIIGKKSNSNPSKEVFEVDGIYYNKISDTEVEVANLSDAFDDWFDKEKWRKKIYEVSIPSHIEYKGLKYTIISIGDYAYSNCENLKSVQIPNSVEIIGKYAFDYCTKLESVSIPSSVKSIGECAFNHCSELTSIIIPNGVTIIPQRTFNGCKMLKSVTIPNTVSCIASEAFYNCNSITTIVLPSTVNKLDYRAFGNCFNLTTLTIKNPNISIEDWAFRHCNNLKTITLPKMLKIRQDLFPPTARIIRK